MVVFPEPLTFSGSSASILIVPLTIVSAFSHVNLTSALLLVEVTMVRVQSFCSSLNGAFSSFSLVMQLLEVLVLVFSAEFAFILASILARCSGVSLARNSAGMGISPLVILVVVVSQRPVLTFRGGSLSAAQTATDDSITNPAKIV